MLKIRLRNWMSHEDVLLDFRDQVGMVVAANGVGKTAIRDAIEFVFLGTGKLRGIDTKKDLAKLSIQDGFRQCVVELTFGGTTVVRSMNDSGTQKLLRGTGGEDPVKVDLSDAGGTGDLIAEDVLRIILEPTEWFRVSDARHTELLLLATRATAASEAKIEEALLSLLEPETDAEKIAIKRIATAAYADGMRAGEAHAVERRVDAKRRLAIVVSQVPEPMFEGVDLRAHALEDHEATLKKLCAERDGLLASQTGSVADASARSDEAFKSLKVLLDFEEPPLDPKADEDLSTAKNGIEAAGKAQLAAVTALVAAQNAKAKLVARQDEASQPIAHPGQCPHLPVMACPVKPAAFEKARSTGNPDVPTAGEILEAELLIDQRMKEQAKAQRSFEKWRDDRDAAAARVLANSVARDEIKAHHQKVDLAEKRVKELDDALKALKDAPVIDPEAIAILEARIAKGERVVSQKRAHDAANVNLEAAQKSRASLEREIACWDSIAVEMKPGGKVEKLAAGEAATGFLESLAEWAPITGEVSISPGTMAIQVGPERRHTAQLSTSQRLGLGIAIQHAFAREAKFPILISDAIDLFDGPRRSAWLRCALALRHHYAGGIVGLATSTSGQVSPPPAGCVTLRLTNETGSLKVDRFESAPAKEN